jgi:hypothetical protein
MRNRLLTLSTIIDKIKHQLEAYMADNYKLGKLEKLNIRDIWKNEAKDFTNWLAEEENLALLSEEIDIPIKFIKTEASVGAFSADILAEEENTGNKIIIENQLEETDHDHLGKIITYGSGFNAKYLLWIFKDIREEHRQAIDWLNEKTDSLYIFALKMEVWKIGDSMPAPKFQIICSPNNWAKAVKQSSDDTNLTDTNLLQLDFWTNFSAYLEKNTSKIKIRKPQPQHWYDLSMGNSQLHISCIISFQNDFMRCDIYIPDNKDLFKKLFSKKDAIEKELGFNLEWEELPTAKASRIKYQNNNINLKNKSEYENYFKWLKDIAEKYIEIIPRYY